MVDTVVCIGSGPSLEQWQVDYVKKRMDTNVACITANDAYKMARFADIIYAADRKWWRHNLLDVTFNTTGGKLLTLKGHSVDTSVGEVDYVRDIIDLNDSSRIYHGSNSGQHIVHVAYNYYKPKKIILIGFDFQHTNGKRHFFGDHPKGFINAEHPEIWVEKFEPFAKALIEKGVDIVNCSTETAIQSCRRSYLSYEI